MASFCLLKLHLGQSVVELQSLLWLDVEFDAGPAALLALAAGAVGGGGS